MMAITAFLMAVTLVASSSAGLPDATPPVALSYGDRGPWVSELNDELAEAGFHANSGNVFGRKTRHAVYAFQKHHGLPTTGRFTALMWDLLDVRPDLPERKEADRIEIDLSKQVLYVVEDQEVVLVVPISSGNGRSYVTESGGTARATTPEGRFRFQRRIRGMREAFLGKMWNPYYFSGGFAVHGSYSVPNYPASHGCIRVTMWDMNLLISYFEIGQRVYIYGKRKGPPPALVPEQQPDFF